MDEDASACIMSSSCWKAIGSPALNSSPNALEACLVNLVCPKLLHLICQSGNRKLMKCGALYVQDNLFLNFLSFLVFLR